MRFSVITQANDQNNKTISMPTPDLHSVNRTDIGTLPAISDAIIKDK